MNAPQCDPKLEQSIIGACLIDPNAIVRVMQAASPDDFYIEKHRWIYESMVALQMKGEAVDVVAINADLERRGKTKETGGMAYIVQLMNSEGSSVNIDTYVRQLVDFSGKRKLLMASSNIAGFSTDGLTYEEAHDKAVRELLKVSPHSGSGFVSSEKAVGDLLIETRIRMDSPSTSYGTPTGYADWDKKFGGLFPGLHIIEGRTSSGKTWMALGIAENVAARGIPVAFISLEMSASQISMRRVSRFSGLKSINLRTGYVYDLGRYRPFNSEERRRSEEAHERAMGNPLFVSSEHFSTSSKVIASLNRMKMEKGIGLAVIDYIQKLRDRAEREEKALGDAAHNLKDCADSLGIPVIALSQVNRGVNLREERFIGMGDTRGSGQIEEAADAIFALSSEDYGKYATAGYKRKNIVEVACLKDRLGAGAGNMIQLSVIESIGSIENLEGDWK